MLLLTRLAAWLVISLLVLFTIVPPSIRPSTGVSHHLEHFGSFVLAGVLYSLAYRGPLLRQLISAVLFAVGIELIQILVPGRHARLVDLVVDALGACTGIVLGFILDRILNCRSL
jgi:VanZ family protein